MKIKLIFLFAFSFVYANAQMWNGQDTLFGNEWIANENPLFKFSLNENGVYRLDYNTLRAGGFPVETIAANQFQLFNFGEEISIYTSTDGIFTANDFIEFYGKETTSELDQYLFDNPETEMLNDRATMYTAINSYYLTWSSTISSKRIKNITNDLTNLPAKEEFFTHKFTTVNKSSRNKNHGLQAGVFWSHYDASEGYSLNLRSSLNPDLNLRAIYREQERPGKLRLRMGFDEKSDHHFAIGVNGNVLMELQHSDQQVRTLEMEIPNEELLTPTEVNIVRIGEITGKFALSVVEIEYPRTFDFLNRDIFNFELEGGQAKYLEINRFDENESGNNLILDYENGIRIVPTVEDNLIKIHLPESEEKRRLTLIDVEKNVINIESIEAIDLIDWSGYDAEYLIISNDELYYDSTSNGENRVQEYAEYRNSPAGGGYTTSVINVKDLYNYFGYGAPYHPMAVRNFAHYAKRNWSNTKFVFIIGKGLEYSVAKNSGNDRNFVPTWGTNGADNLLVGTNGINVPLFPVGRIPVNNAADIKNYLNKVKEYENFNSLDQTLEGKLWRKKIIHLGGGISASEQNIIASYLNVMANNIENNPYGGKVESYFKRNTNATGQSQSAQLQRSIDDGVGLITFFGHSAATSFDFSINNPDEFENQGRYFIMNALGCNAGQIHSNVRSLSEQYVFAENRGAVAFLASSGLGYISAYRTYGSDHYNELGNTNLKATLGEIIFNNLDVLDRGASQQKLLSQQMTICGDPALRMTFNEGPDFLIDETSVQIEPEFLNVELTEFEIKFDLYNLGLGNTDSVRIKIEQEYPDGMIDVIYEQKVKAPTFSNEVVAQIPGFAQKQSGFNTFYFYVDPNNEIVELPDPVAENNNELVSNTGQRGVKFYIFDNEVEPIYPTEFDIVSTREIELIVSTSNPFGEEQRIVLEVDTTELFNSPEKRRKIISQSGGVIKWTPEIAWQNGTVYYWRSSPDSTSNVGFAWKNSSFLYSEDEEGDWNQSHYFQFLKDEFNDLSLEDDRRFNLATNISDLKIENKRAQGTALPQFYLNNNFQGTYRSWALDAGVAIVVIDSISGEFWVNPPGGLYGSSNPIGRETTLKWFPYPTSSPAERQLVIEFLQQIPDNNYVGIFTIHKSTTTYDPENWVADSLFLGTNLYRELELEGATQIRTLETVGKRPYIFIYKKGAGAIGEVLGDNEDSIIDLDAEIPGIWPEGNLQSVVIGPGRNWEEVRWAFDEQEMLDEVSLSIYGISDNGNETLLVQNSTEMNLGIDSIDSDIFSSIRLQWNIADTLLRTAPQLDYWRVVYDKVPEAALSPNIEFTFLSDTLFQGDSVRVQIAIENLSDVDMDSLLIAYTLKYPNNTESREEIRLDSLLARDTIIARYASVLPAQDGNFSFTIEVNPNEDQPELYHFNNVGVYNFFVEGDKVNPILDVTFDGIHILDRDIVSADPLIKIELNDENKFLALSDTSTIEVGLIYPGSSDVVDFVYDGSTLIFRPADPADLGSSNKAIAEFYPGVLEDGLYTLVIKAQDASGNLSGSIDYKVNFEVVNKTSITNVLNYPNPFSTSTRFVYTMTGTTAPDEFKIQIMTVAGNIVREITNADIGALKVGTHMTDYEWNGTDEFGDKLAAGVYLYRVITKDADGNDYEKRDNNTDQFFEQNIGKMVILR